LLLVSVLSFAGIGKLAGSIWEVPQCVWDMEEHKEFRSQADHRNKAVRECLDGRARVARDVVAGRLTLLEAAGRFRALCQAVPDFQMDLFREFHPGASDEERFCRAVINTVEGVLWDKPDMAREMVRRLKAELADMMDCGTLKLPL
jgi:hypothetical protein